MIFKSWGGVKKSSATALSSFFSKDNKKKLVCGSMLSYGDSCLNTNEAIYNNTFNDNILEFDHVNKEILVETGISFDDLLKFLVPKGYFLPVTPGTKYITVGGAIANDIHGKNHHQDGNFGNWIISFTLVRTTGEKLECSPHQNSDLFHATIGGLGLTGFITQCRFKVIKIQSSNILCETIKFNKISDFFKINTESKDYKYTVAWIDCLSADTKKGKLKGLYMRGNHSSQGALKEHPSSGKKAIPFNFPSWSLNSLSIKVFNFLYYNKQLAKRKTTSVHYDPFFYPLDAIKSWNRIYGKNGLYQFQCVIPLISSQECFEEIINKIKHYGQGSFLSVLKTFGTIPSQGLLSFPEEGLTFALDFPNRGSKTVELLNELYAIVFKYEGKIYPAKDQLVTKEAFQKMYPKHTEFVKLRDPGIDSDWWHRVSGEIK